MQSTTNANIGQLTNSTKPIKIDCAKECPCGGPAIVSTHNKLPVGHTASSLSNTVQLLWIATDRIAGARSMARGYGNGRLQSMAHYVHYNRTNCDHNRSLLLLSQVPNSKNKTRDRSRPDED